jgi:2-polyprenyl-3-methyl-5-hydroxy-6-metoxy-1,4-benzoquinol methylase
MTFEHVINPETQKKLDELLDSEVYRDNLEFWERVWGPVKAAYEKLPDLDYLPRIPETLKSRSAKTVLDLGCGSGWLAVFLARQGFAVTGVDCALSAIRLAKNWAAKDDLEITFDVGDMADLPYPDGSFDAVVANSIFEHLPYDMTAVAIARIKHILVPGGTFIGCFDIVGGGAGEYYELPDQTHVYTDKGRKGMLLRCYSDEELKTIFKGWKIESMDTLESGSRFVVAFT